MDLAGYIRVSTEGQVDAFGKEVQRDGMLRWAGLNGHRIVAWYEEDGVSGKTDGGDRPALAQAIADAPGQFEGIVVFEAGRIARRLIVQETLLGLVWGAGLKVFSAATGELGADEDDPTKILIRQILGVIAEFDHRNIVKRLHNGRRLKSAAGGYVGGSVPYGQMVVGHGKFAEFTPDPVESVVVGVILDLYEQCNSLNNIASVLNERGHKTKMGKQWTAVQVSRVIKRSENT